MIISVLLFHLPSNPIFDPQIYMKRFIICLLFIMAGCKQEYPSIPHDIIPLEKMKNIMAEMTITDAVATSKAAAADWMSGC